MTRSKDHTRSIFNDPYYCFGERKVWCVVIHMGLGLVQKTWEELAYGVIFAKDPWTPQIAPCSYIYMFIFISLFIGASFSKSSHKVFYMKAFILKETFFKPFYYYLDVI